MDTFCLPKNVMKLLKLPNLTCKYLGSREKVCLSIVMIMIDTYKCDNSVHAFGIIFPLLVLYDCKSFMVKILSLIMFIFHILTLGN